MSEQTEGINNRSSQRVKLEVKIDLHSGNNIFAGLSMNISTGGIFVATYTPADIGEQVPISFTLPTSDEAIDVLGEVCWMREYNPVYPDTQPGMGLRFLNLTPADQKRIDEYIAEGDFMLYEKD